MSIQVCMGALMQCSFGSAPCSLIVLPLSLTFAGVMPAGTIMDYAPIVNLPTFAMCNTPSNPVVASATAAASGVLTPMPCIPATAAPWIVGAPTVLIGSKPALNETSTGMCSYGGVIKFTFAGQVITQLP